MSTNVKATISLDFVHSSCTIYAYTTYTALYLLILKNLYRIIWWAMAFECLIYHFHFCYCDDLWPTKVLCILNSRQTNWELSTSIVICPVICLYNMFAVFPVNKARLLVICNAELRGFLNGSANTDLFTSWDPCSSCLIVSL